MSHDLLFTSHDCDAVCRSPHTHTLILTLPPPLSSMTRGSYHGDIWRLLVVTTTISAVVCLSLPSRYPASSARCYHDDICRRLLVITTAMFTVVCLSLPRRYLPLSAHCYQGNVCHHLLMVTTAISAVVCSCRCHGDICRRLLSCRYHGNVCRRLPKLTITRWQEAFSAGSFTLYEALPCVFLLI